ncbi:hypothetical protein CcI49_30525 [Frankia sp. CcI49]|nr:hypothetical protein CcI49_30525 [Frankia sp. CcI49]
MRTAFSRAWLAWARDQMFCVVNVQPFRSSTPPDGRRELSTLQPAGGVCVKPLTELGMSSSPLRVLSAGRRGSKASEARLPSGTPSRPQDGSIVTPIRARAVALASTSWAS